MSKRVLGLGGSNHDFSAAIVEDGRIVVAIEDERINRVRHGDMRWDSLPGEAAVQYCLDASGLTLDEFDLVIANDDLERPRSWIDWNQVVFVNHHLAHAAASFYSGPAEESALLVIDGHGSALGGTETDWAVETISLGKADADSFHIGPLQTGLQRRTSSSWRYVGSNSIGALYEVVSMAIGFGDEGQGKTMGLAAYGTTCFEGAMRDFVHIGDDGTFEFDPYGGISDWLNRLISVAPNQFQVRADLAAAVQEIFNDAVLAAAGEAHRRTNCSTLSFGGGCSLNTVANSLILERSPFTELQIFPAAGDNGLAVGAALYGYHESLDGDRRANSDDWRSRSVYLGRTYSGGDYADAAAQRSVSASRPEDLTGVIADALANGEVVAVHREGSEFGPRALGHRSLLASPRHARMRDHINLNVKHRESFRPLGPVVPEDAAGKFFEGPTDSPHMLLVSTVRPEYRDRLAAVTHVDGTARIQTVRESDNPFLYNLLYVFGEHAEIPVLVNTSLNLPGRPIVETPLEAIDLFLHRSVDMLVLGDLVVRKYTPWAEASSSAFGLND